MIIMRHSVNNNTRMGLVIFLCLNLIFGLLHSCGIIDSPHIFCETSLSEADH